MKNSLRPSASRTRALGFENLETRNLMAGNVTATISNGNLKIVGDTAANDITVNFTANGALTVVGNNATTVNGAANAAFTNVSSVGIRLGEGNDVAVVDGNSFSLGGGVRITDRSGANTYTVREITLDGQVNIRASGGNQTVTVDDIFGSLVHIRTGVGNDTVNLGDITGSARLLTGRGDDDINFNGDITGNLFLNGGLGDDLLTITAGSEVNGRSHIISVSIDVPTLV